MKPHRAPSAAMLVAPPCTGRGLLEGNQGHAGRRGKQAALQRAEVGPRCCLRSCSKARVVGVRTEQGLLWPESLIGLPASSSRTIVQTRCVVDVSSRLVRQCLSSKETSLKRTRRILFFFFKYAFLNSQNSADFSGLPAFAHFPLFQAVPCEAR